MCSPNIRFDGYNSKCSTYTMSTSFKLYGFPQSTGTRRVALITKERNIPYEFIPIDSSKGEHKQASFTAHQPFGQVPYVVVRMPSISPLPFH